MSKPVPYQLSRYIQRILGVAVVLFALATSQAQTAPTLLPYTLSVIAGGAGSSPAAGATCPVSGLKSTDAFGDGCLATEVLLAQPRFVTTDKNGVVYFSDTNNALVRRIDPLTGVITTVAGGATTNPATGAACGSGVALDSTGDGCPATSVRLSKPVGIAFSPAGDLYFADNGNDDVRKVDQTTGIITNIAGNTAATGFPAFGYKTNNTSTTGPVIAATQSYLNFPYGIAFDKAGNLYIADEGNQALSVVNLTAAPVTIQGVSIPAGSIQKFAGFGNLNTKSATSGDCPNFTAAATGSRGGCYFGSWTDGALANVSNLDNPYDVAIDAAGSVYFANYFNYNIGRVTAANVISNFAGKQGTKGSAITRGVAGSFGIGNTFDVALDSSANLYLSDGSNGVVWRVDAGTLAMYAVAGGATTVCATATDPAGDGCPATQALFQKLSGSGASLVPGGAGGLFVDPSGNLLIADSTLGSPATGNTPATYAYTSVIRMAASGTSFGAVGANQPTQIVAAHFAAADPPASNPFALTAGSANFSLGAFTCPAANSDGTTDCTIAITATPSTLGPFTGTLKVTSSKGASASFALTGTYVTSRLTRTAVAFTTAANCSSNDVSPTTPVTLTANVVTTGIPTGTVQFFSNGVALGAPQSVSTKGIATLASTFAIPGTFKITAVYSGDVNFNASTSSITTIVSSMPTFTASTVTAQLSTVTAGQTALYSFNISQTVYTGTISFACSGLPAYASCSFSPATIAATGCSTGSTPNVVAMSIYTQQAGASLSGFGSGPARWQALTLLPGIALAAFIGIRRRKLPSLFAQLSLAFALLLTTTGLAACGKVTGVVATPSGTSTVTVTATGSAGTIATLTVPLTVK